MRNNIYGQVIVIKWPHSVLIIIIDYVSLNNNNNNYKYNNNHNNLLIKVNILNLWICVHCLLLN